MAGLTVAIVALPLALAFGLIAFAPVQGPAAGLWSAILAGFIAAMLGGSSHAITGPTGVLAVLTAGLVATHGGFASPNALLFGFLAVALSGVFQILFGLFRLAKLIEYVPYPVITGFMNGTGSSPASARAKSRRRSGTPSPARERWSTRRPRPPTKTRRRRSRDTFNGLTTHFK
jgi:MFS superfamily sulfate permease-like transporter